MSYVYGVKMSSVERLSNKAIQLFVVKTFYINNKQIIGICLFWDKLFCLTSVSESRFTQYNIANFQDVHNNVWTLL